MNLVETIWETSQAIQDGRGPYQVLAKSTEELGELSTEVAIFQGDSYKLPGNDGVVGEAVDLIITAVDMIYQVAPETTSADVLKIAQQKLLKWAMTDALMNKNNGIQKISNPV